MKIIRNNFIPFKGFKAINLFGILFVRGGAVMSEHDLNHERIHSAQMKELLFLGFYICYLAEWIRGICSGKSSLQAYHDISFEKEAYRNQNNLHYLATRKPFSQWQG